MTVFLIEIGIEFIFVCVLFTLDRLSYGCLLRSNAVKDWREEITLDRILVAVKLLELA